MDPEQPPSLSGDMSPDDLRRYGHELIEWVAHYMESAERHPVLSTVRPGEVAAALNREPPVHPTPFDALFEQFQDVVLPGITHWNHPGFFAYFGISASGPGILGELLAAALNVNAMLWRTSPAATELEAIAVDWLRQLIGLPEVFQGHIQDTASTSTLVAIATAREATGLEIRSRGLAGNAIPPLRLYCSEEAHSSVEKAAITLGIGSDGVRRISTDHEFRLDPDALADAITADIAAGVRPFCVVATIGTTSTTSVDPVPAISQICREYDLWLHVDAAYGGAAAIVPEMRALTAGWESADSIVVNPHKWLFVPIDCSVLLLRDPEIARRAFALTPAYLATPEGESVTNLMDYGPALGRRFRSLKLWMTLGYFGQIGLERRIAEHIRLARLFASWIDAAPDWTVTAPVPFSTVCFRYTPPGRSPSELDWLNAQILQRVNDGGEVYMSHTVLRDRFTLRLAIGNIRTEERHVAAAWKALRMATIPG